MPVIKMEFDDAVVSEADAQSLCVAVQKVVADATGIEDVFVYGNSSQIKVKIAPIEIWVEISAHKVPDRDALVKTLRSGLSEWKEQVKFPHLINLTLNPLQWQFELGI